MTTSIAKFVAQLHALTEFPAAVLVSRKVRDALLAAVNAAPTRFAERQPFTLSADAPNGDCIVQFFHCKLCLEEIPDDVAPRDWARLNVGFTREGLQVWCVRHDCNVTHLDFLGQRMVSDDSRKVAPPAAPLDPAAEERKIRRVQL